jgi:hypothetical protein
MVTGFSATRSTFRRRTFRTPIRLAYQVAVGYDIVGVKIVGNTVVVGTQGKPVRLHRASHPMAMAAARSSSRGRACRSRAWSIWASASHTPAPQGLALVGPGVQDLITRDVYTLEEWTALNPPRSSPRSMPAATSPAICRLAFDARQVFHHRQDRIRVRRAGERTCRRCGATRLRPAVRRHERTRSTNGTPILACAGLRLVLARVGVPGAHEPRRVPSSMPISA